MSMKQYFLLPAIMLLSACGGEPQSLDNPQGLDTVEMFSSGAGVEGAVSSVLHPDVKDDDIKDINETLYSRSAASAIGLVKYETSKQSKAKIREFLKRKGGIQTFDNKGTFGITTYTAQAIRISEGSYLSYEVQAIFVRNEDNISMLYDYGLRWDCRKKDNRSSGWTIAPCGSTID